MKNKVVLSHKPKISVIIPVYNSEKYLENCLDSIVNQSLKEIEIILVDDGSKDKSAEICDSYSEKDDRITVIHQENKGICDARNAGLKRATGEYVTFCDNDDYVKKECYKISYEYAIQFHADIVRFRRKHTILGKKGKISTSYSAYSNRFITIKDWKDYIEVINKTGYGVWAGIYRRTLISSNRIEFDSRTKYGYEDNIFSATIYKYAKKILLIQDELYEWIQRAGHSASMKKGYDVFLNRLKGILIWKSFEKLLIEGLVDDGDLYQKRQYDYMKIVIEEIRNSGLRGYRAKRALLYAKDKLKFKSQHRQNYEEWVIDHNHINMFMIIRYFRIIKRIVIQRMIKLKIEN